jgi:hypothetical protein
MIGKLYEEADKKANKKAGKDDKSNKRYICFYPVLSY